MEQAAVEQAAMEHGRCGIAFPLDDVPYGRSAGRPEAAAMPAIHPKVQAAICYSGIVLLLANRGRIASIRL